MATAASRLRLVGRGGELAQLESELRRAVGGELRCVLLLADPGIGKTRLADELIGRHRRTALGLNARAYPLGGTASFGLWVEALERHLVNLPPDEVRALCGGLLDDLAGLLRSVAAVRGSTPARDAPHVRLLQGLTALLRNLATRTPVVLLLDDVHLADASSWEVLGYLARNLAHSRILIVAAARPAELSQHQVGRETLLGLEQEGLLTTLRLTPLSRTEMADLAQGVIDRPPPGQLVDWLFQRSRGYPLFALGLLRGLIEEGVDLASPSLSRLPEDLSDRVMSRLKLLDEPSLATLEVLAVVGRRVELKELGRLSGRTPDRLATILERLVRARLVVEEERDRQLIYEVSHPLVQETIYQAIGGARRRALHRLTARALAAGGQRAAAASHYARCASPGEPEAIEALIDALRQAEERESHREAMTILDSLLDLLPSGDPRWLQVLDAMSWDAEWVVDHQADLYADIGVRAMIEIARLLEGSDDLVRQGVVQLRLTAFRVWRLDESGAAAESALSARQLFAASGDVGRTLLAAHELSWVRGVATSLAAQESQAKEVVRDADLAGERVPLTHALGSLGYALFRQGRFAESEAALRRSIALSREDGKHYRLAWNLSTLAYCLGLDGRMEEALDLLKQSRAASPAYADTVLFNILACVHWLAGNFATALASWSESAAWNEGRLSVRRGWGMLMAAIAAAELGRIGEARHYLERARQLIGPHPGYGWGFSCEWLAGLIARSEGDLAAARASLERAAAGLHEFGALPDCSFARLELVEVAAEAGDQPTVERAAAGIADIASAIDHDLYRALANIAESWRRLGAGEPDAAAPAQEAVRLLEGRHYRAFEGRAHDVLGRALAATDREAAAQAMSRAAALFLECGATARRARSLEALNRMGPLGRRAAASKASPLSRREREVARLAVEGCTAREIATRLFISERTVESHLANAYAKLGIDSRLELVRRAAELST